MANNSKNQTPNLETKITFDTQPVLKNLCAVVPLPLSADDNKIMQEIIEYVKWSRDPQLNQGRARHSAVGLAANQIGYAKQMFYMHYKLDTEDAPASTIKAVINPKIIQYSQAITFLPKGEGCLSVEHNDDYPGIVPRHQKIVVEFYDYLQGKTVVETLRNFEAIVFQHEFDHLQGHLYYERIDKANPEYIDPEWTSI